MNALVMYDHQTRTLWSQFLGKGVKGHFAGVELGSVPVIQTTWDLWRTLRPDTLVLDKQGGYRGDRYRSYYRNGTAGVLGETHKDDRLDRKELVLGVNTGTGIKAYPFSFLESRPVVNDSLAGRQVLVFFDRKTDTALVYDRTVGGKALTFRVEGSGSGAQTILVDNETGSRWMAFSGKAIEGQLEGESLVRVLSHLSFWFAWKDWNPDTELFAG